MKTDDRFWSKVNKDGPASAGRPELGPCWLWTATQDGKGYGQIRVGGHLVYAHRFAYELLVGPIPEGLQIDHLCRVRHCVNTDHLEPVTQQENIRRGEGGLWRREKTHCPQGHPYDEENTYLYSQGRRDCRACRRAWRRCYREAKKVSAQ